LGKFWKALKWNMFVYLKEDIKGVWYSLRSYVW
jgi:hypothetical protein